MAASLRDEGGRHLAGLPLLRWRVWAEGRMMVGKLESVPLREVWKHETLGLTTWLLADARQQIGHFINDVYQMKRVHSVGVSDPRRVRGSLASRVLAVETSISVQVSG